MLFTILQQSPVLLIGIVFIIGLLVGSFLNVVIYRLPIMMERSWRKECLEFLDLPAGEEQETFNLMLTGIALPCL